ncbi:MAG: sulfatase/phosphatase domain-containing protein, partial [Gemmataceae bacterium]
WAVLENTPFRLFKHFSHEGGISSPLIAHWPKGIQAKGEWRTDVSHLIDIMPTVMELSGAKYPTEFKGQKILPMEGRSLVAAFAGKAEPRGPLFWEHENNKAVRDGKWKLVEQKEKGWELYDMETDRTETNNLAAKQPEKVKELSTAWDAWAKRAQVIPRPKGKQE